MRFVSAFRQIYDDLVILPLLPVITLQSYAKSSRLDAHKRIHARIKGGFLVKHFDRRLIVWGIPSAHRYGHFIISSTIKLKKL